MEEWKIYKLGEITSKIGSGATPKGGRDSYLGGNISLIRSQNVLDFSFSKSGLAYINEMQAEKLNNVEVYEKDVLLNITGDSVARVCIVPNNVLPARVNQHVAIIRGNEKVDYRYLLYYLQYIKPQLLSLSQGGATRNALTKKMIEELEIKMPSKGTQKEIVSILYTLDTKIALNRRINDNLEQQAQALFKSWFVDFEPFKGRKFVESEMGMIPEGWKVGVLSDFIELLSGFAFKSNTFEFEGKYKLITIKAVQDGYLDLSGADNINNVPDRIPIHCFLKKKDILLSLTGNVGRCCLVNNENLLLNQRVAKVEPKKIEDWAYSYILFRLPSTKTYLETISRGTAQANLSPIETANMPILIPPREIMDAFSVCVTPIVNYLMVLTIEAEKLAKQRETLLPKLMSGELKINDLNC